MEPTSNASVEAAAAALATATALPMTATGEDILTLVGDLARIARYLGALTAAARDRWADWGTVTPHLQQARLRRSPPTPLDALVTQPAPTPSTPTGPTHPSSG